jgi:uncharacterized protein involved in exopolysaccharide biosynthesis
MQQLPLTQQSEGRKLVEDLYDFLGTLVRGWRLVAFCVAITVVVAGIYLARAKPLYQATSRLLVLQHGGQPINVASGAANHDNLFQSVDGVSNSLATHLMIIRSPLIVSRALDSAGLKNLAAGTVIGRLSVKLPNESARVLEVGYKADSRDEAVRVVDAVIKSYDLFLKDNYQKNSNEVLSLITKARDELSTDLRKLEKDYLEYRQKNPAHGANGEGKTFLSRRLEQWDQTINQAALRSLQLKAQLDLGRRLADEGAGVDVITNALGQVSGGGQPAPAVADRGAEPGASLERLEAELAEVELQRQTAERLLEHLRDEQARAASSAVADGEEIARAFADEPGAAEALARLSSARAKLDNARRLSRSPGDPSVMAAARRVSDLEDEVNRFWRQRKSAVLARLGQTGDDQVVRQAASEAMVLKAKEAALRERLDQFRSQRLGQLQARHDRLAREHGPGHPKAREVREQIARLKGDTGDAGSDPRQAHSNALLRSIEEGIKSVEAVRAEVEQRFERDLSESKKDEIGLLTESNLRNNLERQRALFYSIVDQLKQAQLASDFGSVTAQVLDPPFATASRPSVLLVLLAALAVGCGLGGGRCTSPTSSTHASALCRRCAGSWTTGCSGWSRSSRARTRGAWWSA